MKTPVVLHIECGIHFLTTMLDRFGADGWNGWQYAVLERLPMSWSEGADEPPARLWFEAGSADFTGMRLDGADFGLVNCEAARFDRASAVGTMFGTCPRASFRNADLREAVFIGDITAADFSGARLDGVSFVDATYNPDDPPVGLPIELLRDCRAEPIEDEPAGWPPAGIGLVKHTVNIKAALAASATG